MMLCEHTQPGTSPFETLLVIEDHLGLASGIVACRRCGATYQLELIDLDSRQRAYRVSEVDRAHADAVTRTLTRGSCDINRAESEVQHLDNRSKLLPVVLVLEGGEVVRLHQLPGLAEVPRSHWRALPCDGRWLGSG